MIISVTGQILILSGLTIVGLLVNRILKLELTLSCALVGLLMGLSLEFINIDTGVRAYNLQDIIFFIVLPVLIFEAAWNLKLSLLKKWVIPVLVLAIVGVLISCVVTAALIYLGIGHSAGFPWIAALLTGAILAATDPVAVISQLHANNAPDDLTTLFEGESLFNDAAGIVLFTIVLGFATQTWPEGSNYIGYFASVFFGGIVVGLLVGLLASLVIVFISNSTASKFILVLTAFASFYCAEHLFHVSGILAVTIAALTTRFTLDKADAALTKGIGETWEWLGLFFNSFLFVLMGLVVTLNMFSERWLAIIIAIVASLIARMVAVIICSLVTKPLENNISMGWQILLVWGGMRGAIAIALVLSLPTTLPYWWTIQSAVFGVVVFSMIVQGTTNAALIKKYGCS
ncbi:MAG: sodium:proton antiporter [Gammaproteobacteria bacterium]|nr:MAG: sodium:proton antiporter [Gammaproteobacteria bacterium]